MKKDFIVVGQGLAGSVLALNLIKKGFSVTIIDQPHLSQCSKVAAGIWNPVVFKRLTKSWMVDLLLPFMLEFYSEYETLFQVKLLHHKPILKYFSEKQEVELWKRKCNAEMKDWLDSSIYSNERYFNSPKSYSKVLKTGHLDVNAFLHATRTFLEKNNSLINEEFSFKNLIIEGGIQYQGLQAKNLIFCEGFLIKNNPFFNYLPLKPAKGEIIKIKSLNLPLTDEIINKNGFILPVGSSEFKVGATYNWEDLDDRITEEGLRELNEKAKGLISYKFEVIEHRAGVRPSVIDRRPLLGTHPRFSNLHVFNGLGTKGVMLAPYFSNLFSNYLMNEEMLPPEVDIQRFSKFFVN